MGVTSEMLETAQRFRHWEKLQSEVTGHKGKARPGAAGEKKSSRAEREMEADRLRFSGLKQLNVDPGVFLESILEDNDLTSVSYFERGKLASRPVGRIHFDLGPRIGQGFATGFLVAPGLLLTNHHVLPSPDIAHVATVTFDAEDGVDGLPRTPHVFRLEPQRIYLSDKGLDFCFVAVADASTQGVRLSNFGYLRLHQTTGKILRDEYATIIQHPRGRQKQVAVRNNEILVYVYDRELEEKQRVDNNHIYYETDTLPGSSGAPVFSDQWYVVALHRRGVPRTDTRNGKEVVLRHDDKVAGDDDTDDNIEFVANEGVRISRIVRRLEALSGGEAGDRQAAASGVLARIQDTLAQPDSGPFWVPTAAVNRLSGDGAYATVEELEKALHRTLSVFKDAPGFDENFLGVPVGLPQLGAALKAAAARRLDQPDEYHLPFHHYTTVVHAQRRLPIFAAVNINGENINASAKPKRPGWSYDPRLDETHQPDDSIFSNMVQRGHMAAREFMWWGDDDEARAADIHSFTLSNVCPQIDTFNGQREWFKLERLIMGTAKSRKQKVNCFMGPLFSNSDPLYDDLRGSGSTAAVGTGIRMPRKFWYVLAWRDNGALKHRSFILDQSDDITDAGPLEFDFAAPATVSEVDLSKVVELAKLTFPGLA
jgi:endonuclease G